MLNISDIKSVFNLFFPAQCLDCNKIITENNLCPTCESFVNKHPNTLFLSEKNYQGALFYYELTIRKIIIEAKFSLSELHALALMDLIEKLLQDNDIGGDIIKFNPSAVAYVPTHFRSRLWRGFDLPHLFALKMANFIKVPVVHILIPNGYRMRQSSLTSRNARKIAIKDAFRLKSDQTFERLILLDDIITTGATFDESLKCLQAICKDIRCLAIAKTP